MGALRLRQRIILNQPHIITKTGSISSDYVTHFNTDLQAPLKECKIYFNPIQEGSGNPSPDNVRPITGWTEINLKHSGINMLNCSYVKYSTGSGLEYFFTNNSNQETESIRITGTTTSDNVFKNLNYDSSNPYAMQLPYGNLAMTGYSSDVYIVPMTGTVDIYTDDGRAWWQANSGDENGWNTWIIDPTIDYQGTRARTQVFPRAKDVVVDTTIYPIVCLAEDKGCEFEAYKGSDYNTSWADNVGTVYGGYVDLISGELASEWGYIKNYNGETLNMEWISDRDVYVEDGVPTNGAKVIYKLAEPITYQLTPQQLVTFKGTNNIWSNSNSQTEVKFWTH